MTENFSDIKFRAEVQHRPVSLDELVQGWISHYRRDPDIKGLDPEGDWAFHCQYDLVHNYPSWGWKFVLGVLATAPDHDMRSFLAAGPMEDLLASHGPAVIDRVEQEAQRSPAFRHLLGSVWQNAMPDEIWHRVLKAASERR